MIFINYRRAGTSADARSIHLYLRRTFRPIFIDIDSIPMGLPFPDVLERALAKTIVMLVVIGPSWTDARDESGRRRLENEEDFVRMEISRALAHKVTVIPVLVDGATLPRLSDLPADLRPLIALHATTVGHATFPQDMNKLAREIFPAIRRSNIWFWLKTRLRPRGLAFLVDNDIASQARQLARENQHLHSRLNIIEAENLRLHKELKELRRPDR